MSKGIERITNVKICGIRDERTIRDMDGLPVHYIGFVFAPSKRQVTVEQAAHLHEAVRKGKNRSGQPPRTVGVFVNPSLEQLAYVLDRVPLDAVQLHGQESPAFCREVGERFGVEVWRALSADEPDDGGRDEAHSGPSRLDEYEGVVSTILIDTAGGGTGRTFRWELIPSYQERAALLGIRLFVAGGLGPDNITELLSGYQPDGVDVSSGVETDGAKDSKKIAAFAERVNRS
ncbi:phosphoribosylanthranilate isomerase [Cohnella pontilimi]|uniref:N-(5'-phosphoribosyl)anthranilate isomerase n=1 Tax=Cohnella pontilimi TaxID=2564100 RepID=A0A4U0FHD3_9BACL|nr:phosphoribosylanthranilate isomerase [Cohnella pontilimi]TJY44338.1 phosphoribosylanthranilate isomerase [Cohnella pontilimi]